MADGVVAELAARARAAGRLGIDTEFMGEGRYRSLLCLVQIVVEEDDGVRVEYLDPLTQEFDPAPLAAVLADPDIQVVMHAGRQDVALLRREWQTEVRSVFDTQVAAGFAGLRAQLGYEALLHEMVGVRLRKTASFTRWDARPLSEEQLGYAREDVLHLLEVADALQGALADRGRLEWALEECRVLESASDEREPEMVFNRLPRVNSLDPGQRAVAFELVEWRDATARESDRPVPSILADAPLIEVAKRRPPSLERLAQIRGLNESTLRRRGRAIISAVERGRERDPIPVDGERPPPTDTADAPLIALGEALVRARAAEAELAYELIAARADLQRIVTAVRLNGDDPDVRTLQGWRREVVGGELLELLRGRRALRVGPGRRIEVESSEG
ncbi:MAG: ribonuclease [Solirubrobacteraceae bacterium]|jgi:ribonuclease D|nr:ribonuclease [Solirubrobacteraceae bacterium]MEA2275466.1 ribonuclease [Solirubrobacteraceae bacterium]MEA2357496.1 ribonuclease [Solirubrobacteraceae bacterium]